MWIDFKPSLFFNQSLYEQFRHRQVFKTFWIDLLTHSSHINNIITLPLENLFTQTLHQKSKTMQGWLPFYCGDNWDLFTVKRKWIFTITARSRYRCSSASPASISRIFSRKKNWAIACWKICHSEIWSTWCFTVVSNC